VTIRDELLALKDSDGLLVPETVLEWARRHQRSALHAAINWDVNYNVVGYLLIQVRNLITLNIRDDRKAPEMISLSIDRAKEGGGYREISDILVKPSLRRVMLRDALQELDLLQRRFEELEELEEIWGAVVAVKASLTPKPPKPPKGKGGGKGISPSA